MSSVIVKFIERQAVNVVPKTFIHKTIIIEYKGGYSRKGSCLATEYHALVVHPFPFIKCMAVSVNITSSTHGTTFERCDMAKPIISNERLK
jgi:hypothetical protein